MDAERPDGRIPRRLTDRVEDAVAWLLISLALLTGVVAFVVGAAQATQGSERARLEARERVPVRVILLERADVTPSPDGMSLPVPVDVPARWILPDGSERVAPVATAVRNEAGAELRKWIDRSGRPVPAPSSTTTGLLEAVLAGVAITLAGWLTLLVTWWGVRRGTAARNAAGWAREWHAIEPSWTGRLPWQ